MHAAKLSIVLFVFFLQGGTSNAQNLIHLLGVEVDNSNFGKNSYATMYDSSDDESYDNVYAPYWTLGIVRNGDEISFLQQNYLIVPTAKGFVYITQEVTEVKNDTTQAEMDYELNYELGGSYSKPKLFTDKTIISKFIDTQKTSFKDAISITYRKLSFVTPNFYITEGFDSEVHGGATWFNATEKTELVKLNPKFAETSNKLREYFPDRLVNEIIVLAVDSIYGSNESEPINENYLIPWGGEIKDHDDVYFTFEFYKGRPWIEPLTLLNGNSARSFLTRGSAFRYAPIIDKFIIRDADESPIKEKGFWSPDNTTDIEVKDGYIYVYNVSDAKLLAKKKIMPFNKIIMSEWALGKYVNNWEKEFK